MHNSITDHQTNFQVEHRTSMPIIAISLVSVIPALLALIYIGSSTVFEDVVSLSVSGLYASYFIPCAFLLWRRTTGQILDYPSSDTDDPPSFSAHQAATATAHESDPDPDVAQPRLVWGPWRIPGIWGTINNAFACLYIIFVFFWSFWPPRRPTTAENMNYSVLVTGTVIGFSVIYYYIWGKEQYKGPLIERELMGYR